MIVLCFLRRFWGFVSFDRGDNSSLEDSDFIQTRFCYQEPHSWEKTYK